MFNIPELSILEGKNKVSFFLTENQKLQVLEI